MVNNTFLYAREKKEKDIHGKKQSTYHASFLTYDLKKRGIENPIKRSNTNTDEFTHAY